MPKVETFDKALVIAKAIDVFHDKGFNATSMQDLVDATGLNRSSIYNSFGCKLELYIECLNAYKNTYQKQTSQVLLKANTAFQAIELVFDMYLKDMLNDKDNRGCMITNCKSEMANHDNAITSFLHANEKQTLDFFKDLVIQGQQESSINTNQSPDVYALFLFSSLQGLRMTSILVNDKSQLQSIAQTILKTIV